MNHSEALPAPGGDPSRQLRTADAQRLPQPYPYGAPTAALPDDDVIDLRELWRTLMRRKWTIALVSLLAVVLALIATFNATPIFKGTVLLQIDRTANRVVEYGNVVPEDAGAARDQEFYATQYELLRSRSLARRVIDQVGLRTVEEDPEPSLIGDAKDLVKGLITGLRGGDGAGEGTTAPWVDPEVAERKREEDLFLASLTISPVRNSRLVRVEYDSPDPREAAAVANAVANNFISLNLERRYDASSYAKEFLEQQLEQMRATLEDSEKRFVTYAREREIVNMDDRLELLLNTLREMNTELVSAEAGRIASEAEYQEMLQARQGGSPGVLDSAVIQSLKERRGDLQAEYQQKLDIFKPGYPDMVQLRNRIEELSGEIDRETASITEGVRARFQAKVREEAQLRQRIQEIKNEALALQDRSTDYETLRREVQTNRELYDGLLQRMKEVGVAAGVGENNVSVVDAAQVPPLPYKPSLTKNLAIALALGLFLGVGLAFLLETLDDTLKSGDEVERRLGAPVLSMIPYFSVRQARLSEDEGPLIAFRDPKCAVAEASRSLRTSLLFSTADGAPRLLHFTSCGPGEGKTTTAVSTAVAFAQAGGKVLLIDADLRNPSLHRAFSLPNALGLTNHLAGDAEPADIAQPTQVKGLFTITSGPLPPNPVELLSTAKMVDLLSLATERFDHVIIDGPPVLGLADAPLLANLAKATLFIVEPGSTRGRDLDGAAKRLYHANVRVLGAVLTKVGRGGQGYGYGAGYDYDYHYLYSYGAKGSQGALPQHEPA